MVEIILFLDILILIATLRCRPTAFLGVPRVWEKIMEKMLEKAREIKGLKKKISREAKRVGLKCNTEERQTTMFKVFQKIYYTKVKTLLGLDQATYFFTAAAPISREVCQQAERKEGCF